MVAATLYQAPACISRLPSEDLALQRVREGAAQLSLAKACEGSEGKGQGTAPWRVGWQPYRGRW